MRVIDRAETGAHVCAGKVIAHAFQKNAATASGKVANS